jgi:hypothetical protein
MKGHAMAVNPQANLPAALSGALGAITTTREGVKKAAAQVYNPPAPAPETTPAEPAAPAQGA